MKRAAGLVAIALLAMPAASEARVPTTPVVMVVFDELPATSLLGRNGRVDPVRHPNFAGLARASTWYSNATTVADSTRLAIPSILDGREPRSTRPATYRGHPRNVFTLLRGQGYQLRVQEEATALCPYPDCRRRFSARYFLAHDRVGRFRDFVRSLGRSGPKTLYYQHSLLPHAPWLFLPSTRRFDRTVKGPISGLVSSERSVFDRTLVRQAWQRHLLQVRAVDTLLGDLIARMKLTGLWDRALLVVLGDHGVSFRLGATDRRTIVPANARDIAPIPLFIKYPGQRRGRIDRSLVRTTDVLPTIARRIGLRLPRAVTGRSASSAPVRRRRSVTVYSRARIGRMVLSRRALDAMKRTALRRRLRLFGAGNRSLFDFGPNRVLLRRAVASLRVVGGGGLRATLNGAADYRNVDTRDAFLPAHVTGRILGRRRGRRRDVAIAVNGVVRGVSRSVRVRRVAGEHFSVLVPESALAAGANSVEVFVVSRRRGRRLLRRIYGRPFIAPSR